MVKDMTTILFIDGPLAGQTHELDDPKREYPDVHVPSGGELHHYEWAKVNGNASGGPAVPRYKFVRTTAA